MGSPTIITRLIKITNNKNLTAYTFSRYANVLVNDNNAVDFEKINTALLAYKYKEKVAQLEPDLIKKIKDFLHV
jgi:hypothetical protein